MSTLKLGQIPFGCKNMTAVLRQERARLARLARGKARMKAAKKD